MDEFLQLQVTLARLWAMRGRLIAARGCLLDRMRVVATGAATGAATALEDQIDRVARCICAIDSQLEFGERRSFMIQLGLMADML